jgi:hypothetical protein
MIQVLSVVGIATDYGLDDRGVGVRVPVESGISLSPEIKRPDREADHSPSTDAEVKNTWIYTSNPAYAFVA